MVASMPRGKKETFVSVDVETDGPIPGLYSMRSLGAAAFSEEGELLGTFSVNLRPLPGAGQDPRTMQWWSDHPEAWQRATVDAEEPPLGMRRFVEWLDGLPEPCVFVGYPTGFDFTFTYWYLIAFRETTGGSPFSFSALDIKTYAMALLGTPYRESTKRAMPKRWFPKDRPHTHVGVDDAIGQGMLFINMLRERAALWGKPAATENSR
jgi:hypothetical protein